MREARILQIHTGEIASQDLQLPTAALAEKLLEEALPAIDMDAATLPLPAEADGEGDESAGEFGEFNE